MYTCTCTYVSILIVSATKHYNLHRLGVACEVNFCEINSYIINFHQINCSRDQLHEIRLLIVRLMPGTTIQALGKKVLGLVA